MKNKKEYEKFDKELKKIKKIMEDNQLKYEKIMEEKRNGRK